MSFAHVELEHEIKISRRNLVTYLFTGLYSLLISCLELKSYSSILKLKVEEYEFSLM